MKYISLRLCSLLLASVSLLASGCALQPVNENDTAQIPAASGTSTEQTEPVAAQDVISQVTLYQVILDGTQSDYTGAQTPIGCNDTLIAIPVKSSLMEDTKYADLWSLLSKYDAEESGFHNPRKTKTTLAFQSYELLDNNLIINLTGPLQLGGACELPRLEESIVATYKQFGFDSVDVRIDGKTLHNFGNVQ